MPTDDQQGDSLTRRPVLRLLAGGAIAVAGIGGLARLSPRTDRSDGPPSLILSSHDGYGVDSLDIPLDSRRLSAAGGGRWQTERLPTSTHSMVALTWVRDSREPRIRIRSRVDGRWQEWRTMPTLHDLPDLHADEGATGTAGTDLVWIGAADGVQVDLLGDRPKDLTLVLLHPTRARSGLSAHHRDDGGDKSDKRPVRAPHPELLRRADWGAEKSWRPPGITYDSAIRQVHVHHTVNSNTYSKDDVPGLIRGMYRYHTHNLGWSDIGYNFLVDRFGRTWVGRAGGSWRPVRGAHTLGFNATSCGVSVIGNYETVEPSDDVLDAIAALAAWKLDRYDANPGGHVTVTSEGSDKYAAGRSVRLPVIDGHRDTNDTACPGRYLYEALPQVRRRARAIVEKYDKRS